MFVSQPKNTADDVSKFIAIEELMILCVSLREAGEDDATSLEQLLLPGLRGYVTNGSTRRAHAHLHLQRMYEQSVACRAPI